MEFFFTFMYQFCEWLGLNYLNNSFKNQISINTLHCLHNYDLIKALNEIERVSKKNKYICVESYRNEEEKKKMMAWNLTAKTIMSVDNWKSFFKEIGFKGDYYWFIP